VRSMLDTTICPKTPRSRNLTKEQKQAEKARVDAQYKVDHRQFNTVLKEFAERAGHLAKLNQQFGQMKEMKNKGVSLQVDYQAEDGKRYLAALTRKELKAANSAFQQEILCLKHYFRMSKKKAREKAQARDMKGTYTPVYAAPALREFLRLGAAGFGPLDPSNPSSGNLMDQLPYAQNGYMLRNSTTMLFFIYAHQNNLQYPPGVLPDGTKVDASWTQSDQVMSQAFDGNIPPAFYRTVREKVKYPYEEARAAGLQVGRNTYDDIRAANPQNIPKARSPDGKEKYRFDPAAFKTFFFQNIAAANYFSRKNLEDAVSRGGNADLQQALANIDDATYRQQMLNEHQIIKGTSDVWAALLEPARKQSREERKRTAKARPRGA